MRQSQVKRGHFQALAGLYPKENAGRKATGVEKSPGDSSGGGVPIAAR
jgi:hypothetical protein